MRRTSASRRFTRDKLLGKLASKKWGPIESQEVQPPNSSSSRFPFHIILESPTMPLVLEDDVVMFLREAAKVSSRWCSCFVPPWHGKSIFAISHGQPRAFHLEAQAAIAQYEGRHPVFRAVCSPRFMQFFGTVRPRSKSRVSQAKQCLPFCLCLTHSIVQSTEVARAIGRRICCAQGKPLSDDRCDISRNIQTQGIQCGPL